MGKSRHKKFRVERPKPTGLSSVRETEQEIDETRSTNNVSVTVQTLIDKLCGASEEERECGCTTIANLVSQPTAIKILLQQNIVKILAPLILDKCPNVQIKALGALRNLSVDGGEDVCNEMVRRDVLTPLVELFKQFGKSWVPEKHTGRKNENVNSDIFKEAVHILWNLCEYSEEAVDVFNKTNLIALLVPCLQYPLYGTEIAITVGHCLHTVTEDNTIVSRECQQPEVMSILNSLMTVPPDSSDLVLLRTLATGILVNICSCDISATSGTVMLSILGTMSDVLAVDAVKIAQEIPCNLTQAERRAVSMDGDKDADKTQDDKCDQFHDIQNILSAQQVALEIVANICCISDGGWEDMDNSESSCDDVTTEEIMEEDLPENGVFFPLCVPSEVQSAIKQYDIFTKILTKCETPECKNICNRKVITSFERLQAHALLCLNNMVSSLDIELLGGLDRLHQVWTGVALLMTQLQGKAEKESLFDASTSALRAVVQKMAELQSPKLLEVSVTDLQLLYNIGQSCNQNEVRVNALRIVATVGCVFSKLPEPQDILKSIGSFLLHLATNDRDLWVVAEALDSIFDVFAEDHLGSIDQEIGLTEKLSKFIPEMKTRVNGAKKKLDENYPVISTAKTNLLRFVKYKMSNKKVPSGHLYSPN